MAYFDVFNGDADGICALQQLRLADPVESHLVTGIKRDISLVKRVDAQAGDNVCVLDVSLDKNREALAELLRKDVKVDYFDHHFAGDIPSHSLLTTHIDTAPETCTSLIVNAHLKGQYSAWAAVGAFGDNFDAAARKVAKSQGFDDKAFARLRQLGIYINYNGYGASVDDLHFAPDALFRRLQPYVDPLQFVAEERDVFQCLQAGAEDDLAKAQDVSPEIQTDDVAIIVFPAQAWARRVSGVYSNQLASGSPDRAHALLTALPQGGFVVSVRAPMNNKEGADELCRAFPTGGGRKAAAGINALPDDLFADFVDQFKARYSK